MRDPLIAFRDQAEFDDRKLVALKRRRIFGVVLPLVTCSLVGVMVYVLMQTEPRRFNGASSKHVEDASSEESQVAAIASAYDASANERARIAAFAEEAERTAAAEEKAHTFAEGDIVVPVTDCLGFAEETDLHTFRAMLKNGDSAKARKFYEQLRKGQKSGKISKDEELEILSVSWSNDVMVEIGDEHWWVAPDWVKYPGVDKTGN